MTEHRSLPETGLKARAFRGSLLTMLDFGSQNFVRLVSNLILTRLLFPEAFGLMALVQVFLSGLQMFSDIGIRTSIMQSPRGDDPEFLNTAWTLQILRGGILWLGACALAHPVALLYGEPMLSLLLPVAGLNAVISAFISTNIASANRHLRLGRQTLLSLIGQVGALAINVTTAYLLRSVWGLVWGGLFATTMLVILSHTMMPGIRNRLAWNREVLGELIRFGRFIFLSTVAGFLINQGDRAILGKFVPLSQLGVYSIAAFLGTLPFILARALNEKVLMPLYRMRAPAESEANRQRVATARRLVTGSLLTVSVVLAYGGVLLVDLLYDARYALAGPMIVLFSLAVVPQVTFNGYTGALLASGDSKRFFYLLSLTALLQVALMVPATWAFGAPGAILAPGLAALATHPVRLRYLRLHHATDTAADALFLGVFLTLNGLACWLHQEAIAALFH